MTAKLSLKFNESVLRELALNDGVVTIGRQPDNLLRIDNPIVSGHHAKIYWDKYHYVLEDNESFNGTYLNNRRVSKETLKDGDVILIGKHVVKFQATLGSNSGCVPSFGDTDRSQAWQADIEKARPPQLDATMVLDTRRVREMLGKMAGGIGPGKKSGLAVTPPSESGTTESGNPRHRQIGTVTIVSGRTNQRHFILSSKLSVIGKSKMASIQLKRWFAPRIAASIHQREEGYFLVAAGRNIKMKINDNEITNGQQELEGGDQFQVAGITARFAYEQG